MRIDIKDRIRCNKCGNFERFYAHRSPEDDVMSRCLLIQESGHLFPVKGSIERKQCDVHQNFYQKPWYVYLYCAECGSKGKLNHEEIDVSRIEKEYWRFEDAR